MLKKIYTVLVLIKNLLIRKKNYTLTFFGEEYNMWYYKFKHWGFDKEQLMMVAGADKLCTYFDAERPHDEQSDKREVTVKIKASKKPLTLNSYWMCFKGEDLSKYKTFKDRYFYGRNYTLENPTKHEKDNDLLNFWICPVTLFVLGRYPNYLYIKRP